MKCCITCALRYDSDGHQLGRCAKFDNSFAFFDDEQDGCEPPC